MAVKPEGQWAGSNRLPLLTGVLIVLIFAIPALYVSAGRLAGRTHLVLLDSFLLDGTSSKPSVSGFGDPDGWDSRVSARGPVENLNRNFTILAFFTTHANLQHSSNRVAQISAQQQDFLKEAARVTAAAADGDSGGKVAAPRQRCAVFNGVTFHLDVTAGLAWAFQVCVSSIPGAAMAALLTMQPAEQPHRCCQLHVLRPAEAGAGWVLQSSTRGAGTAPSRTWCSTHLPW